MMQGGDLTELQEEEFIEKVEEDLKILKTNTISVALSLNTFGDSEEEKSELLNVGRKIVLFSESFKHYKQFHHNKLNLNSQTQNLQKEEEKFLTDLSKIKFPKEDEFFEKILLSDANKRRKKKKQKSDEESDVQVVTTGINSIISNKCPLTQLPFILPVSQKLEKGKDVCFHTFEQKEIICYIRTNGSVNGWVICPIIGCGKRVYANKLSKDVEVLEQLRITRFKEAERNAREIVNNVIRNQDDKNSDEEGFDLTAI